MSASFTDEQEEIRRYARRWLDERAGLGEVRRIMETEAGFDPGHWRELAELGWPGIGVGEKYGGSGYGFMELAVLAEEMGRSLFPSPFLSTAVMGAALVEAAGSDDQKEAILPGVTAGERRLAVAAGAACRHDFEARAVDGGWQVSGSARFVLDGHTADTLVVEAGTSGRKALFTVDADARGVSRQRLDVMDLTRPQAELRLSDAPANPLGEEPVTAPVMDRAVAAVAMEQVGGAQTCLDMSVEYARHRHQFGRPIGSFQAIKHMCADMLVAVESARSAAYHLAWAIDNDPGEVAVAAPLAKAYCGAAFFRVAADTIQVHGGIGFTWEHDAHLYLKRAKSSQLLFGDAAIHRSRLADTLGIG